LANEQERFIHRDAPHILKAIQRRNADLPVRLEAPCRGRELRALPHPDRAGNQHRALTGEDEIGDGLSAVRGTFNVRPAA
jgi:hypothetical protein